MIHTWANIALIFLIILSIVAWVVPLVLLLFSVRGGRGIRERVGRLMPQVQQRARQATDIVERSSRRVAHPIIRAHAWWAGVQAAARTLRRRPSAHTSRHNDEVNS